MRGLMCQPLIYEYYWCSGGTGPGNGGLRVCVCVCACVRACVRACVCCVCVCVLSERANARLDKRTRAAKAKTYSVSNAHRCLRWESVKINVWLDKGDEPEKHNYARTISYTSFSLSVRDCSLHGIKACPAWVSKFPSLICRLTSEDIKNQVVVSKFPSLICRLTSEDKLRTK